MGEPPDAGSGTFESVWSEDWSADSPGMGTLLPNIRVPPPGPVSRELATRLSEVESRNVTYLTSTFPVFWKEARGANVVDVDGNLYLDLTGAFGVASAGHTAPGVVEKVRAQAGSLIHGMGDVHPPVAKLELLEALGRIAPWPSARAILSSSGSEAVESALKTALLATGKPGILAFEGAYHGLTLGALSTTHREDFRAPFLPYLYPGVAFAPFPTSEGEGEESAEECLDRVAQILRSGTDGGHRIGAVLVEPIQGRAGVRIPPPGFLEEVGRLAREAESLLIFDEIFTGLGRTGRMFGFLHENVVPDLLCVGKGLGGGLPLSACVGPEDIMSAWPLSTGEALHTSTFLGNPLACAAGVAFLRELEEGGLVERSNVLGRSFRMELRRALKELPSVKKVRGRGLFLGIEFHDPATREPMVGAGARIAEKALGEGILVLPAGPQGEVVELTPPLVLTESQMDWVVPVLAALFRDSTR